MTDIDSPTPPKPPEHNLGEVSVSELANAIKHTLEGRSTACGCAAEISGFKRASSAIST